MTKLIVFEGIDGSGKSTVARKLHSHITHNTPYTSLLLKYPERETPSGECVTQLQYNPPTQVLTQNWDALAVVHTLNKLSIRDRMGETDFIIADRYVSSSIVYTAGLNKQNLEETLWLKKLNYEACKLPTPFLQILVDTPLDVAKTLLYLRGGLDNYDTDDSLQERVYDLFHELFVLEDNWIKISNSIDVKELFNVFCTPTSH